MPFASPEITPGSFCDFGSRTNSLLEGSRLAACQFRNPSGKDVLPWCLTFLHFPASSHSNPFARTLFPAVSCGVPGFVHALSRNKPQWCRQDKRVRIAVSAGLPTRLSHRIGFRMFVCGPAALSQSCWSPSRGRRGTCTQMSHGCGRLALKSDAHMCVGDPHPLFSRCWVLL